MIIQKQKPLRLLLFSIKLIVLVFLIFQPLKGFSQCFSSVNPVGGTANLLVLDQKSLRFIGFYRHAYSNSYYEGHSKSDFDQINNAGYNYSGSILAYGLFRKLTLETEWGYYLDKTFHYNLTPVYTLRGSGFTNTVISSKFSLYTDYQKRLYLSGSAGIKIPLTRKLKEVDGVTLPVDLQPSTNAFGTVFQLFFVKENSESGMRYFFISRFETNRQNINDYRLGNAVFTSMFVSRHLPDHWIKGDWTVILQLRNEFRTKNKRGEITEEYTGGNIFLLSPQINYRLKEKWNFSLIFDIPVYQYYNGIQLAYNYAFMVNLTRDFNFYK